MSTASPQRRPALDLSVPFTKAEFRRAGLDERRLRTTEFRTVFYGLYVRASVPDSTRVRALAALKVAGPQAHVSHHTAAELHELCPPGDPSTHVSTPEGVSRSQADGIRSHRSPKGSAVVTVHGVRMSSPVQTFLDLAGLPDARLVPLVIVGDRLVRKGLITPARLVQTTDEWRGRGCRLARRAARLVREGVDSPMETRLRLLIVLAGLPEPQVNLVIRWPDGSWKFRMDLSYPEQKIMIEYDGRHHVDLRKQWLHDIKRLEELARAGWDIIRVTSEGVFDDPMDTVQRVHTVVRGRTVPGAPGRLSDEWRRHFADGR